MTRASSLFHHGARLSVVDVSDTAQTSLSPVSSCLADPVM